MSALLASPFMPTGVAEPAPVEGAGVLLTPVARLKFHWVMVTARAAGRLLAANATTASKAQRRASSIQEVLDNFMSVAPWVCATGSRDVRTCQSATNNFTTRGAYERSMSIA
jgi:hypothetical protein